MLVQKISTPYVRVNPVTCFLRTTFIPHSREQNVVRKRDRQTETEIGQIHPGISCTFQDKSAFNAREWCHVSLLFVFETQCRGQLKMGYVITQWMGLNGKDGQGSSVSDLGCDSQRFPGIITLTNLGRTPGNFLHSTRSS